MKPGFCHRIDGLFTISIWLCGIGKIRIVRVERIAQSAEIIDGQPQPHEVEPAVAFESEFAAPFGGQFAAELRLAFDLVGRQFVEACPRAGLVEPHQRIAQTAADSASASAYISTTSA